MQVLCSPSAPFQALPYVPLAQGMLLPPSWVPVQHFHADMQVASGVLNLSCSSRKHWLLFFWLGGVSSWVTSSHAPSVCSVPSSSQSCVSSLGPRCGCLIYTTEPFVLFSLYQTPRVSKLLGSLWFLKLPGSIPSQHSQVICLSFSGAVIPGMFLNCSTLALNGAAFKIEAKQSVATLIIWGHLSPGLMPLPSHCPPASNGSLCYKSSRWAQPQKSKLGCEKTVRIYRNYWFHFVLLSKQIKTFS